MQNWNIDRVCNKLIAGRFLTFCLWFLIILSSVSDGSQRKKEASSDVGNFNMAGHRVSKVLDHRNSPFGRPIIGFCPNLSFQDQGGKYWLVPSLLGERIIQLYDEATEEWTVFSDKQRKWQDGVRLVSGTLFPSEIFRIGQSKDGKIWFSSRSTMTDPLGKPFVTWFDGSKWQEYKIRIDSDHRTHIGLFSGRDGRLWFWNGDELTIYDGNQWSLPVRISEEINSSSPEEPSSKARRNRISYEIYDGMQDSKGNIWLATACGIIRFNESRNEWKKLQGINQSPALTLYEDRLGRIWIGGLYDVSVYDTENNTVKNYWISDKINFSNEVRVNAIYQDKHGQMLFGLDKGLLCYSESGSKWELFDVGRLGLHKSVEHIMEDKVGRIWITTKLGVLVLD